MRQPNLKVQQAKSSEKGGYLDSDWIKNLDIMGEKFKLQYTTRDKTFKTRLGGIVTLLVTLISFVALFFISSQYFDTSSPVVTTSRELFKSAQGINLVRKTLLPPISVRKGSIFEPQKMNNFMTVVGQIVTKTFDPQSNSTKLDLSNQFNYIPCSQLTEHLDVIELIQENLENIDLRIFLCPQYKEVGNNVTISIDPENLSSSYLSVKIYPCSLPDKNDCFSVGKVAGAGVMFGDFSPLISPSNYEDPVEFRWRALEQYIDLMRTKSFRYLYEQYKIVDDRQIFGQAKVKAEYETFNRLAFDTWARNLSQLYCTRAMIEAAECEEYMEFVYEMSNEVTITRRRYKKIPALLGEFGGVLKILTTTFAIISFSYSYSIQSFLFDKVFRINNKKARNIMKKAEVELCADSHSSRKKRHESPLKKREMVVKQALEEVVPSKTEIGWLIKKMNFGEILKASCMEKHHRTLLPLVLLLSRKPSDELMSNSSLDIGKKSSQEEMEAEFERCFSEQKEQEQKSSRMRMG